MAKIKYSDYLQDSEKEFLRLFDTLTYSRSAWQVWEDLMTVMACSISNAVDRIPKHYETREKEYENCIKRLGSVEIAAQMLGIIVMALEKNPEQDFLGTLYMNLNLASHWHGQFFTPYNICQVMAKIIIGDCEEKIKEKGWISIGDPCVGGGAMLIAAANMMKHQEINYQQQVVFVGQDIDRIVAMMAYIQLSLLGCPGYIVVGDSLIHPFTGSALFPQEREGQEVWITPMFITDIWTIRRCHVSLKHKNMGKKKAMESENFYIFFDFKERENKYGNRSVEEK